MDRLYLHIINRNTVCNKVLHSLEVVAQSALSLEKYSQTKGIKHLRKSKETTLPIAEIFFGLQKLQIFSKFLSTMGYITSHIISFLVFLIPYSTTYDMF